MNNSTFILLTFTQIILLIILQTTTKSSASTPPSFTKIYAFGDSYTDTGNTFSLHGHASSLPYGITYFHHPTNRYSDGRLMIDFVASHLKLPFLPPYKTINNSNDPITTGVNFAVAGSTAIEYEFFIKNNVTFDKTPESLKTELSWFSKMLEKQGCGNDIVKCSELLEDTLIWVGEIGGNDYAYTGLTSVDNKYVQGLVIRKITKFLEAILLKGAKYVVIQGLPPTGCLTVSMLLSSSEDRDDIGCAQTRNSQSSAHNTLLQTEIEALRTQFPDAFIVYADFYNAYSEVVKNPAKYGIEEVFKVCCGSGGGQYNFGFGAGCGWGSTACPNPSQYINWDGVHLTEGMYKVISELMLKGGHTQPPFQEMIDRKMSQE